MLKQKESTRPEIENRITSRSVSKARVNVNISLTIWLHILFKGPVGIT